MSGQSVVGSATSLLTRTTGNIVNANYTIIVAMRFNAQPTLGDEVGVAGIIGRLSQPTQGAWEILQEAADDPTFPDQIISFTKNPAETANQNQVLGTTTNLKNKWIHYAAVYTGNLAAGSMQEYAALEGFNPAAPSYLINVANTIAPAVAIGTTNVFNSGESSNFYTGQHGHFIFTPQALSAAQVIAQWQQRKPTATVVGGGSYTYLPFTNQATAGTDQGTLASNFTQTGTLTDSGRIPLEWSKPSSIFYSMPSG
jgi:hypothetical protein